MKAAWLERRVEYFMERSRADLKESSVSAEFSSSPSASSSAQARSAGDLPPKLVMHEPKKPSKKRQPGESAAEAKEKGAAIKQEMTEATEQWRRKAAEQERQQQWGLKQKENALLERAREAKKLLHEKVRAERMVATKERRVRC